MTAYRSPAFALHRPLWFLASLALVCLSGLALGPLAALPAGLLCAAGSQVVDATEMGRAGLSAVRVRGGGLLVSAGVLAALFGLDAAAGVTEPAQRHDAFLRALEGDLGGILGLRQVETAISASLPPVGPVLDDRLSTRLLAGELAGIIGVLGLFMINSFRMRPIEIDGRAYPRPRGDHVFIALAFSAGWATLAVVAGPAEIMAVAGTLPPVWRFWIAPVLVALVPLLAFQAAAGVIVATRAPAAVRERAKAFESLIYQRARSNSGHS